MTSMDLDGRAPQPVSDWTNAAKTFAMVLGLCGTVFFAGVAWGQTAPLKNAEQTYIRKDGAELEAIKGELRLINEKLERIERQQKGQ